MIGSALCAGAQTWGMLLVGRSLQGLGAAGIMNLSRIILSDKGATLAQVSRNNSTLSLISGVRCVDLHNRRSHRSFSLLTVMVSVR